MNECKCGRIPPCYGGKKFRIHEELEKIEAGDETHDKVYELNKQMCDLERGLSNDFLDMQVRIADKLAKDVVEGVKTPDWAKNMLAGIPEQLSRAEYEILEEILKEKNRFMKEKKTRKMTKAEAFEYFKKKRVVCDNFNSVAIQRKFFEVGIKWRGGSTEATDDRGSFMFVDLNGCLTHCNSRVWFDTHEYEEISADDILSIEIIEDELSYDKVVELAKPLMAYLNEVGFRDSIRVSQFGIVHEPMSTLIFDNGIGE